MTNYVASLGTGAFLTNTPAGSGRLELRVTIFYAHVDKSTERLLPTLEKVRVEAPSLHEAREQ